MLNNNTEPGRISQARDAIHNLRGITHGKWNAPTITPNGFVEYGSAGASARDYTYEKLGYGSVNAVNRNFDQWHEEFPGTACISRKIRPWDISWIAITVGVLFLLLSIAAGDAKYGFAMAGIVVLGGYGLVFNTFRALTGRRTYRIVPSDPTGVPVKRMKGWRIETPVSNNGQDLTDIEAKIEYSGLGSWIKGAEGEEIAGSLMRATLDHNFVVLHDVKVPLSNANADHILLGQRMAFNVDSKNWNGQHIHIDGNGELQGVFKDPFGAIYFEKNAILGTANVPGTFPTASIVVITGTTTVEGGIIKLIGTNDQGNPEVSFFVDQANFATLVNYLDQNAPASSYHRDSVVSAVLAATEPA